MTKRILAVVATFVTLLGGLVFPPAASAAEQCSASVSTTAGGVTLTLHGDTDSVSLVVDGLLEQRYVSYGSSHTDENRAYSDGTYVVVEGVPWEFASAWYEGPLLIERSDLACTPVDPGPQPEPLVTVTTVERGRWVITTTVTTEFVLAPDGTEWVPVVTEEQARAKLPKLPKGKQG